MGFITLKELQALFLPFSTPNEQARNLVWNLIRVEGGRVTAWYRSPSVRQATPCHSRYASHESHLPSI